MESEPLSSETWPDEYKVDIASLDEAQSESPFLRASFELLKEATGLTALAAGLTTNQSETGHDRNCAVLVGHLVRMTKLMRTLIRAVVDGHGGDQQMQLVRQFIDSASTLAYLLEDADDSGRFQSYLMDSLIAEREFLMDVRRQVADRGGKRLPIEERIEQSIADTFASAGLDETQIPSRKKNGWPSAQERIALLGPVAYVAFRMGSGAIHGSWHDIVRNHLEEVSPGLYAPNVDAAPLRPQSFFAMALLGVDCARRYIERRFPDEAELVTPRYDRFVAKLNDADARHERYLANRTGAAAE
ncbi:DUF5677 domain-containing protein [Kribbella sp. CA-253562]|uniref:DUF5677 domain-containing protein n=1 Tax=Kribbella sp. CA-253562 TaxID=3239942 RepID=UPI003D8AF43F